MGQRKLRRKLHQDKYNGYKLFVQHSVVYIEFTVEHIKCRIHNIDHQFGAIVFLSRVPGSYPPSLNSELPKSHTLNLDIHCQFHQYVVSTSSDTHEWSDDHIHDFESLRGFVPQPPPYPRRHLLIFLVSTISFSLVCSCFRAVCGSVLWAIARS